MFHVFFADNVLVAHDTRIALEPSSAAPNRTAPHNTAPHRTAPDVCPTVPLCQR